MALGEMKELRVVVRYDPFSTRNLKTVDWEKMTRHPLSRVGMAIRSKARSSIKVRSSTITRGPRQGQRKKASQIPHSKAPAPPFAHTQRMRRTPLKGRGGRIKSRQPRFHRPFKDLFFSVPYGRNQVIVGPAGFGAREPVTALHERGGTARRFVGYGPKRKKRQKTVHYPKRPYMEPAYKAVTRNLARAWRMGKI